jgi:hypothetical protein
MHRVRALIQSKSFLLPENAAGVNILVMVSIRQAHRNRRAGMEHKFYSILIGGKFI